MLVAHFDAQGCVSLIPLSSSWGERLLTLTQSAAVVFLIVHYRSNTVKGIWTRFQCNVLNDANVQVWLLFVFLLFPLFSLQLRGLPNS